MCVSVVVLDLNAVPVLVEFLFEVFAHFISVDFYVGVPNFESFLKYKISDDFVLHVLVVLVVYAEPLHWCVARIVYTSEMNSNLSGNSSSILWGGLPSTLNTFVCTSSKGSSGVVPACMCGRMSALQ